eukprot:6174147-Amphidinium_carterae.1
MHAEMPADFCLCCDGLAAAKWRVAAMIKGSETSCAAVCLGDFGSSEDIHCLKGMSTSQPVL